MQISTATVIGANGTMGCNVAGMLASFGGAKVYMVSRRRGVGEEARERAARSVRAGFVECNLVPVDFSRLEECVAESDLVFESVSEDMAAKLDVWGRVGRAMRPDALACTGTSGLSVDVLASALSESLRCRFAGMHFFNPPYAMRLCELCPSEGMSEELVSDVKGWLEGRLHRIVVEVSDAPAFLGNRIGFELINRAMAVAGREAACGGIDYIDAIMGPFTGRAMAPLATADFVGLDVHKAIVDNVFVNAPDDPARGAFVLPAYCRRLIGRGRLGRKARGLGGLYLMNRDDGGNRKLMVYEIGSGGHYRPVREYELPFAERMVAALAVGDYKGAMRALIRDASREAELCRWLLGEYVAYSLWAAAEVAGDPLAADDVMAAGFNWCPPLALARAISLVQDPRDFVEEATAGEALAGLDIDELLAKAPRSRYDYRRYLRASR